MTKYGNKKVSVNGRAFDSKKEAKRFSELELIEKAGIISDLVFQPKFEFSVNGKHCFNYFADNQYFDIENQKTIVEDVKSEITRKNSTYRLKKKIIEAAYNIKITEV